MRTRLLLAVPALLPLSAALLGACGAENTCPPAATPLPPLASAAAKPEAGTAKPPTPEEAKAFVADVDVNLRRLWVARDRAGWVSQNFITDDTETLAAGGEEATSEYITKTILAARRFDPILGQLDPQTARMLHLLKVAQTVPAPEDAAKGAELAKVQAELGAMYGKGKYCPTAGSKLSKYLTKVDAKKGTAAKTCLKLDDLGAILKSSRDEAELREAFDGWHTIAVPMKDKYLRYVTLGNEGAKTIGFDDLGALWRAGYDMTPADFEKDIERLWGDVKPLYDELHCYVKKQLRAKYGDKVVASGKGAIPAHLLGNMWAQEWNNIYDLVEPYKGQGSLDVDKGLAKYDPVKMVKTGESFFTSLGMDPLPKTFWERSLFTRPADREVVCHASAWDVEYNNDLRIKMCIKPTEEDLITIHHELGHDYYFHAYFTKPILFQQGANDGFHEGIGDTLALAVTPQYLKNIGLLSSVPNNEKATINVQMKQAIEKVAFLPFGLLVDKWRWEVFSGKTAPADWNKSWWALREKYQGIKAPAARPADAFDPGAKYHIPGSTPYMRYFLARVYQFQFYKALCDASGHKGPLHTCSFFGSKEAGKKLQAMLALGAEKPWPEAMKAIAGTDKADAAPLLEYFAPLRGFLKESTKGETCGW
jgi:peptidyl-dipeptidase A